MCIFLHLNPFSFIRISIIILCIFILALHKKMAKDKWVPNEIHRVEDYLYHLDEKTAEWAWTLHEFLLSYGQMRCSLRWSLPFYGHHKWLVYLNPKKPSGLECCFMNFKSLSTSEGILHSRGRSMVAGLKFPDESKDIHVLEAPILETVLLDRGY